MAPLQDQVIPVDFGGGVDSKTDSKKVVAGKYLLIENGVFTKIDQVRKRNGYTKVSSAILGGGSLVAPKMIRVFQGELVCQDQGNFYGFSETLNCWVPKGTYQSIDVANRCFYDSLPAVGQTDASTLNNLTVYSGSFFLGPSGAGSTGIYAAVVDQTDGNYLLTPTKLDTTGGSGHVGAKSVVLGTSKLGVVYEGPGGLALNILTSTSTSLSFGSPIVLDSGGSALNMDTATTATGIAVIYQASGSVMKLITVDTAGAVTHTVSLTGGAGAGFTQGHVCVDPNTGNIWAYWQNAAGALVYAVYSSTLAAVHAVTVIESTGGVFYSCPSARVLSSTQQQVYYGASRTLGTNATGIYMRTSTVTSAGAIAVIGDYLPGVFPRSHITTINSRPYMMVYKQDITPGTMTQATLLGGSGNTYYLIDLLNATVVGRIGVERAYTSFQTSNGGANLGNLAAVGTTGLLFAGTLTLTDNVNTGLSSLTNAGAYVWTFTFGTNRTYKSEVCGDLLIMNGALLSAYDGGSASEWNFNMRPEIIEFAQTGAGSGTSVTRTFQAVYQWTDLQGQVHQSEPSNPVQTTASPNASWTVYISSLPLTGKTSVQVVLYESLANATILYEVPVSGSFPPVSNTTTGYVQYTVDQTDATLLTNGVTIYTTGGVLENNPPQPSLVLAPRQKRLWYVDAESTNNTYYTKSFEVGTGLSPSLSLLIEGNPDLGGIQGLSPMDDKIVFFKDQGITWTSGDGAGDTGQGATLAPPQNLPSDVGIATGPSLILTPKGIVFQSTKGFYLLDRSLGLHYADQYFNGSAVEQYNSQVISDARMTADTSQIRFLTQAGTTLVYDYIFDKWATFTNHLGIAADVWNGAYVYLRTDGSIYQANETSYLDDSAAFALRVQTSWLALGGVLGFERVRIAQMLGDYASGTSAAHGLQLSFAYNFGPGSITPTYTTPVPCVFAASTSGPFQERWFPAQQKCGTISLLIEEIVTGASGEYLDLTNLSFLAGVKRGLHKLPASSSVG